MTDYDYLIKQLKDSGIRVREVSRRRIHDYAGMNWLAAKVLGYRMPKDTIDIDIQLPVLCPVSDGADKTRTLSHEVFEVDRMKAGMNYWDAHTEALINERKPLREVSAIVYRIVPRQRKRAGLMDAGLRAIR